MADHSVLEKKSIEGSWTVKTGLAKMLKGGVIMDVVNVEQALIAEVNIKRSWLTFSQASGACAVMALEKIPADIRAHGGVSRMSDPEMIKVKFSI
jgi:pyridoxal 5'-phosphate synthase pdxS subunit